MTHDDPAVEALDDILEEEPGFERPSALRLLTALAGFAGAIALVAWGLPWIADTSWAEIGRSFSRLTALDIAWLTFLTLAGLGFYTFLITGSLPGMTNGKALVVNLASTMVSTVFPMGGAVGIAATYAMFRSWLFSKRDCSTALLVIGVWNFLGRAALPVVAGLWLTVAAVGTLPRSLVLALLAGSIIGGLLLVGFSAAVASDAVASALGLGIGRALAPVLRRQGGSAETVQHLFLDLRGRLASVVRSGGVAMTVGMAGFLGGYFVLFWQCLHVMGVDVPFAQLFAAYAVGRLLTAIPITPGSLGVTEAGALAVLVAAGAHPAGASAGVLLFSLFTNVLQIPAGLIAGVIWWLWPKPTRPRPDSREPQAA